MTKPGSACELAGQGSKPLAVAVLLCELGSTEKYSKSDMIMMVIAADSLQLCGDLGLLSPALRMCTEYLEVELEF